MKNEMTADEFKVGDKVWCLLYGEGEVVGIDPVHNSTYPVLVYTISGEGVYYTQQGKLYEYANRTLFFSETRIEASVTRLFVSKLMGKRVVINTDDECIIGVVDLESSESIIIDSYLYVKASVDAIYEITSENILGK